MTFLYIDEGKGTAAVRTPMATAFFVGFEDEPTSPLYVCTAAHVVDRAREFGRLFVRLKHPGRDYTDIASEPDQWVTLPGSDVAVRSLGDVGEHYDIAVIPVSMLATPEFVQLRDVGPGDDVFFIGLFSERPGAGHPEPIVRFGNVALMPTGKVKVRVAGDVEVPVDAYLVEARSWGGHSGSPVFVYFAPDRNSGMLMAGAPADPRLLGLVQGHYQFTEQLIGDVVEGERVRLNAAIVAVIPAAKIVALLNLPEFRDERARLKERLENDPAG